MIEVIESPLIEVRASGIHGLGAFASRPVARGTTLGVYTGRRYSPGQSGRRNWDNALTYVFALSDGASIDGGEGGNGTRHLNHSCAPNCVAFELEDEDGQPYVVIEARRRIRAGEELFIDYALDIGDSDPEEFACCCGAQQCRGTMAGT
jgi:hypothetical protein